MKKRFTAYPSTVTASRCIEAKKSTFDPAAIKAQLDKGAEEITIDAKDKDALCNILDDYGVDYAWGSYKRGKQLKFKIIYDYDE